VTGAVTSMRFCRRWLRRRRDARLVNLLVEQVSTGLLTVDEARAKLGLDPWNEGG